MIIKFFWYLLSLLTVLLILLTIPSKSGFGSSISQNQVLNVRSSQISVKKFIIFIVLMFFIFSILLLIKH
uniref:Preprotein-translocase subunit g n=1 Tax=Polysiphonia urceolata TaxID=173545 RepID=A0A1Z1MC66_POLUR|nr:preprotein-translocase subunit g [Polysiphonia stricta]ARW63543.1 preprotein-translocase subunit g [Polysiphonia stricta]